MRVLVCGGRNFNDSVGLCAYLDTLHASRRVSMVIHGGARGADELAGRWARSRKVPCAVFPAEWSKFGRGAGPIRNCQMIAEGKPDLVVAFEGGRGTADMIERARFHQIQVSLAGSHPTLKDPHAPTQD